MQRTYGNSQIGGSARVQFGDQQITKHINIQAAYFRLQQPLRLPTITLLRKILRRNRAKTTVGLNRGTSQPWIKRSTKNRLSRERKASGRRSGSIGAEPMDVDEDVNFPMATLSASTLSKSEQANNSSTQLAYPRRTASSAPLVDHFALMDSGRDVDMTDEGSLMQSAHDLRLFCAGVVSYLFGQNMSVEDIGMFMKKCQENQVLGLLTCMLGFGLYRYFTMNRLVTGPSCPDRLTFEDAYGRLRPLSMDVCADFDLLAKFLEVHYRETTGTAAGKLVSAGQYHIVLGSRRGQILDRNDWSRRVIKPGSKIVNCVYVKRDRNFCPSCWRDLVITAKREFHCRECRMFYRDCTDLLSSKSQDLGLQVIDNLASSSSEACADPESWFAPTQDLSTSPTFPEPSLWPALTDNLGQDLAIPTATDDVDFDAMKADFSHYSSINDSLNYEIQGLINLDLLIDRYARDPHYDYEQAQCTISYVGEPIDNVYQAIKAGDELGLRELILGGVDANSQGHDFYGSPLGAATWGQQKHMIYFLLDQGADINACGGRYGTALQLSLVYDGSACTELLLRRGADVNLQGGHYGTALICAVVNDGLDIMFLEYGVDVNAQVSGKYGNALHAAALKTLSNADYEPWTINCLLDWGAHINAVGGKYGTALQAAVRARQYRSVDCLLRRGADVNVVAGKYGTSLQAAAEYGDLVLVQRLLDEGASVHAVGGRYGSALKAATLRNHTATMQLLIAHGAEALTDAELQELDTLRVNEAEAQKKWWDLAGAANNVS